MAICCVPSQRLGAVRAIRAIAILAGYASAGCFLICCFLELTVLPCISNTISTPHGLNP